MTSFLLLCAQRLLSLVHLCVLLFANGYLLAGKKHLYNNLKAYACKTNRYEEKNTFVSFCLSISYKTRSKRRPFALQKGIFYTSKGHVLQCKRASFTWQKSISYFSVMNLSYKRRMLSGVHFNPTSYPSYIIMVYRALFVRP